jgi:polyisoprenyl-phosphate glycosyltransferase
MSNTYISIVIPVYGCCECLEILYQRLNKSLAVITDDYEIIMVNDASPDNSWDCIQELAEKDNRVKGVNLSRNFGQHYAITAGLDYCDADWTVVMDCDLQDQPEMINRLYEQTKQGYDIVVGIRAQRNDRFIKKLLSKIFYSIYYFFTDTKINHNFGNFGIYSRKVIENVKKFREQNRSFGLFVIWLGFSRKEIEIEHAKRKYGKSSYNFSKMLNLAIDSIVSHSNKPLKISVNFGFIMSFISIIYSLWLVINYILWRTPVEGWTSLMVSMFFLAGLIIASIGMLGLYIGKIFNETKNRPLYIVDTTTFKEEQ